MQTQLRFQKETAEQKQLRLQLNLEGNSYNLEEDDSLEPKVEKNTWRSEAN